MAYSTRGIRWDRLGRVALLFVAALVLYLYIGPARAWVTTYRQSQHRKQDVAALQRQHAHLVAQRNSLRRQSTLETKARSLGMVRGSEKEYVVKGLPKH
jgi:cell division protein FtsB